MRVMMVRASIAALAVAAIGLGAAPADAQFAPRGRPLFGAANLRAGFTPDPHVLTGTMGGPVRANQINSSCRGYITPQPSHIVRTRTGFRNLRFVVSAQRDATMMVMLPNGQILCDDDGGERMNPLIQASVPPGDIRVWVGAYSQSNVGQRYSIGFTELSHVTANNIPAGGGGPVVTPVQPVVPGGLQAQMAPLFGQIALRSGFMPDPHIRSGTAGGPIRANQVSSRCRGHITPQPSHVLMAQNGFRQLRILVNGRSDTTLVVMLPNGQILCDDDGGHGNDPIVVTRTAPGPVRIWVGTYSSSQAGRAPYNIGFSELAHLNTNNIPEPGNGGQVIVGGNAPPPPPVGDVVQCQAGIPVTLMGPGMTSNTIAMWRPRRGSPTQITLRGRSVLAGNVTLGTVPPGMRDPVITVTQQRNGNLVVRAEQPPQGRRDRGQQLLMLVRWAGRPTVSERWTGTATQRGPRWSR